MKSFALIFFTFLTIINLNGQNLEERIKELEEENHQLRLQLTECNFALLLKIDEEFENKKIEKIPTYPSDEFSSNLLTEIKEESLEKFQMAKALVNKTDEFLAFCENLKVEMIERTGGMDSIKNKPIGCKDKRIGKLMMIEEKKGKELSKRILLLRSYFLQIVESNPDFIGKIHLNLDDFPKERFKSWEEYKFTKMPLCALLPVITKIKTDAKQSAIATLQFLNR